MTFEKENQEPCKFCFEAHTQGESKKCDCECHGLKAARETVGLTTEAKTYMNSIVYCLKQRNWEGDYTPTRTKIVENALKHYHYLLNKPRGSAKPQEPQENEAGKE